MELTEAVAQVASFGGLYAYRAHEIERRIKGLDELYRAKELMLCRDEISSILLEKLSWSETAKQLEKDIQTLIRHKNRNAPAWWNLESSIQNKANKIRMALRSMYIDLERKETRGQFRYAQAQAVTNLDIAIEAWAHNKWSTDSDGKSHNLYYEWIYEL